MSAFELWTRVAVAVLIFGSMGVFVWFARDLVRMARSDSEGTREDR